ncbi:MAG: hypothetical protein ACOC6H_01480 [Thermoproteota archaeon]
MSESHSLSDIEKETLNYIKKKEIVKTKELSDSRMSGAIPSLKNKGLVEIFKRRTSWFSDRKQKFVTLKEEE